MANLVHFFVIVAVVGFTVCSSKSFVHHDNRTARIVGGKPSSILAYPYTAHLIIRLMNNRMRECVGAIISTKFILTAGQCVLQAKFILARIGSTSNLESGHRYNTSTFYKHPMFDEGKYDNDVAVIEIKQKMELDGQYARPINLVGAGNDPEPGDKLIISGWGMRREDEGIRDDGLHAASVPIMAREECKETYRQVFTRCFFCAGYEIGGVDTCYGDEGAPGVLASSGKLAGLSSFGAGCGRPFVPKLYTRIGHIGIRSFIMTVTGI